MARILLGVCGGIAAYKALELTRLAMKAGPRRARHPDGGGRALRRRRLLRRHHGRPGARHGVGARSAAGRVPRRSGARPRAALAPRARRPGRRLPRRARVGQHDRQARRGPGRQPALRRRARLPAPAARRARDERRDVRARRPRAPTSRRCAPAARRCWSPARARSARPGEWGIGRLPEPPELLAAVESALGAAGGGDARRPAVLVTAGGTREPIDAVRFVGNRSSGRMGFALAEEAARRGARVTVIAANVAPAAPARRPLRRRGDRRPAQGRVRARASPPATSCSWPPRWPTTVPPTRARDKIKKDATGPVLTLELERTDDVLAALAERRRAGQVIVGLRRRDRARGARPRAREAARASGLDAIVLNDVGAPGIGFDAADNEVTIITAGAEHRGAARAGKDAVARAILGAVLSRPSSSAVKV